MALDRRRPVPFKEPVHLAAHCVCFGKLPVRFDCAGRHVTRSRPHDERLRVAVERSRSEGFREARPRQRIVWVDSLAARRAVLDCLARAGGRKLIPETAASQVGVGRGGFGALARHDGSNTVGCRSGVNLVTITADISLATPGRLDRGGRTRRPELQVVRHSIERVGGPAASGLRSEWNPRPGTARSALNRWPPAISACPCSDADVRRITRRCVWGNLAIAAMVSSVSPSAR